MPAMPHPHLVLLRSVVTVLLSALIAQAGWAAAFLGGDDRYVRFHQVGAWFTLLVTVAAAVVYIVMRHAAGVVNVTLAVLLMVAVSAQFTLGRLDVLSAHIFLGILIVGLATALTSWTYRHQLSEGPGV